MIKEQLWTKPWRKITILSVFIACGVLFLSIFRWNALKDQKDKTLHLCTFSEVISPLLLEKFEQETGIKVIVKNCDTDSEMWAMLVINNGSGFDLLTPSGFIVGKMQRQKMLQPINTQALKNFKHIEHRFYQHRNRDGDFIDAVPFIWSYYGLGFRKSFFPTDQYPSSLKKIFDVEKSATKICLWDDNPQDIILLASLYLFGNVHTQADPEKTKLIANLLRKQHKHVYAYIYANLGYYLASAAPLILVQSAPMKKVWFNNPDEFGFVRPDEGTIFSTQDFCIPKKAKAVQAAYQFIDFCLTFEAAGEIFEKSGFIPTIPWQPDFRTEGYPSLTSKFIPDDNSFAKMHMIDTTLSAQYAEDMWIVIKSFGK